MGNENSQPADRELDFARKLTEAQQRLNDSDESNIFKDTETEENGKNPSED